MTTLQILTMLRDERGGQTFEWIAVAAFLMAIGAAVYSTGGSSIATALSSAAGTVTTNLGIMSGAGGS